MFGLFKRKRKPIEVALGGEIYSLMPGDVIEGTALDGSQLVVTRDARAPRAIVIDMYEAPILTGKRNKR